VRIPAKSDSHSDFKSDTDSGQVGHLRSEATLAAQICTIGCPM
jgi:hypothetical protein